MWDELLAIRTNFPLLELEIRSRIVFVECVIHFRCFYLKMFGEVVPERSGLQPAGFGFC